MTSVTDEEAVITEAAAATAGLPPMVSSSSSSSHHAPVGLAEKMWARGGAGAAGGVGCADEELGPARADDEGFDDLEAELESARLALEVLQRSQVSGISDNPELLRSVGAELGLGELGMGLDRLDLAEDLEQQLGDDLDEERQGRGGGASSTPA